MTQIQLPSGCYLLVEVKPDWFDFEFNEGDKTALMFLTQTEIRHITVLKGQWSIICKADELNTIQWMDIVDKYHNGAYRDYELCKYFDACDELQPMCLTADISGLSLIASHNMKPETTLILKLI